MAVYGEALHLYCVCVWAYHAGVALNYLEIHYRHISYCNQACYDVSEKHFDKSTLNTLLFHVAANAIHCT